MMSVGVTSQCEVLNHNGRKLQLIKHFGDALLIIEHEGHTPHIDKSAYVAPHATLCGGPGTRIMVWRLCSGRRRAGHYRLELRGSTQHDLGHPEAARRSALCLQLVATTRGLQ
jgi:hypothetical protein